MFFSFLGLDFVEMLRDEVPKQPLQIYAFYGRKAEGDKRQNERRLANMALSFASLTDLCTTYIPLSPKHLTSVGRATDTFNRLTFDTRKQYHTSALFAAGIDMITRPTMTRGSGANMHSFATTLTEVTERNVCSIEMSLPFDGSQVLSLFDEKRNPFAHSSYLNSLTPNLAKNAGVMPFASIGTNGLVFFVLLFRFVCLFGLGVVLVSVLVWVLKWKCFFFFFFFECFSFGIGIGFGLVCLFCTLSFRILIP
jgi:hypothetical protein